MSELHFYNAERRRVAVTKRNKARIRSLYRAAAKDIQKELDRLNSLPNLNVSGQMRTGYLRALQRRINLALDNVDKNLGKIITDGMVYVAEGTVKDAQKFLGTVGMKITGAFSRVPQDVVAKVASGQVYESGWTLNKAIWGNSKKIHDDINKIIAQGIAQQKSAYDIGKDLEKYVTPGKAKPWDWGKVYPGTNKVIDYNAQRLSRTLVTHAYQQSLIDVSKNNPYLIGLKWEASNSERTCELCHERDGQIYPIDDVPLDHPNGMCTQIAVFRKDFDSIAKELADEAAEPLESPEYQAWKEYIKQKSL